MSEDLSLVGVEVKFITSKGAGEEVGPPILFKVGEHGVRSVEVATKMETDRTENGEMVLTGKRSFTITTFGDREVLK